MANEMVGDVGVPALGAACSAWQRRFDGRIWNTVTSAYEVFSSGSQSAGKYNLTATEGDPGMYYASAPTADTTPGPKYYSFVNSTTGAPYTELDQYDWSGTARITNQTILAAINALSPSSSGGEGGVPQTTTIVIVQGDDYKAADRRALDFTSDDWPAYTWPDLSGATVAFYAQLISTGFHTIDNLAGTIIYASEPGRVRFELSSSVTESLVTGTSYTYAVVATLENGDLTTLAQGQITVNPSSG